MSAPSAALAGVSARRPLCFATQVSALARLRLYTVSSWPPLVARWPAMGNPITPRPMNASFCLLTVPPKGFSLAKRARFTDNYKVSTHPPEFSAYMSQDLTNAIRALAMDAVQAANSGHPGMPMGMAEIALALWGRHLRHNPANPKWADRDRFVLSNGHGSMLLYALLHLTGYDLPMDELKRFRQLHSKTPGHPEYGLAPGVENKPSLLCGKTVGGRGAPRRAGRAKARGGAFGAEEVAAPRGGMGWRSPPFEIPREIYDGWDAKKRGTALERSWNDKFAAYEKTHPELARELRRRVAGERPANWGAPWVGLLEQIIAKTESIATRKASQNAIEGLAPVLPELVGGSADLTGSNLTLWSGSKPVGREGGGNYIYYGVREFRISAGMHSLTLHRRIIPFGG